MSHLSTILNRIKRRRESYRHYPDGLVKDPLFLRLIVNTQEYQTIWHDATKEEIEAANLLWVRYKMYVKPKDRKSATELKEPWG